VVLVLVSTPFCLEMGFFELHLSAILGVRTECLWVASLEVLSDPSGKVGQGKEDIKGMSAEESKAIMRRYFEGAWEQGNVDLLDELLAPDYVNHTPATPDLPTGPEGVKAVVSMFRSAMPDLRVVIEDMIAEGDKVASRYTLEGTHRGTLFGVAPTGQQLSIKSITVERVSDGRIREHWRNTDELGMMRQLGILPPPGEQPSGTPSAGQDPPP
jgi:steroid delta-isomerase-like uncharacterized protein